jgi:metal-dependent HD superfamily phosphatase/phosphodiesterase
MSHSVQIIDHKQLSDGQLAFLAECCGDKSTHSWLTMAAEVVVDNKQYQDSVNFHANRVANLHEAMKQALVKAKSTVGTTVSVTPVPVDPHTPSIAVAATAA